MVNAHSPRKLLQQPQGAKPQVCTTDHSSAFSSGPQWTIEKLLPVALNLQVHSGTWNRLRKKPVCWFSLTCFLSVFPLSVT